LVGFEGLTALSDNAEAIIKEVSEAVSAALDELHLRWKPSGMLVLKMWSDAHRETPLDIFVYEPFDFDVEYERAYLRKDEFPARFASIPALIAMKEVADRTQDRIDIEKLRIIEELARHEPRQSETAGD
jgi:hypothetical protein